jgi:hypothetical protein
MIQGPEKEGPFQLFKSPETFSCSVQKIVVWNMTFAFNYIKARDYFLPIPTYV